MLSLYASNVPQLPVIAPVMDLYRDSHLDGPSVRASICLSFLDVTTLVIAFLA